MAKRMAHYLVGHYPGVPGSGKAQDCLVAANGCIDRLHDSECYCPKSLRSPNAGWGTLLGVELRSDLMPDRRTPLTLTGERETHQEFLNYLRESMILKLEDLDEESARRSTVPSGTSLLGLVKHLTSVEVAWFQYALAGLEGEVPTDELKPTDSVASVVAAYRAAAITNDEIVDQCPSVEQLCSRALTTPEPLSLRWVLVHMVEETARHAGHADILREQIDGSTGR